MRPLAPAFALLAGLMLTACGRQGDLTPPKDAAPADAAIERYFEGGLDGPMKAPGDTETDEPLRDRESHDHDGDGGEGIAEAETPDGGEGNAEADRDSASDGGGTG